VSCRPIIIFAMTDGLHVAVSAARSGFMSDERSETPETMEFVGNAGQGEGAEPSAVQVGSDGVDQGTGALSSGSEPQQTQGSYAEDTEKAEAAPASSEQEKEDTGNDVDYTQAIPSFSAGDMVKGTVVHIDRDGVLVDVGTKSEGIVPPREMGSPEIDGKPVEVGDKIDVYVIGTDEQDGNLILSKKRADFEKAWQRVIDAKETGRILTAMVTDRVKGGLVVDLGIRGFIPASHVGSGKVRNLDRYVGQSLPLKVIEVDKDRRKVVLSHRIAVEEERERQRQATLQSLAEGQIRTGIVRRITDYGAFIDLGGVDGLLHISEMSWTRVDHPSKVVKQGERIHVMVLKVDLEANRISLGLRQILPDPWNEVPKKYHVGDIVKGTISRIVPFGAFVQLEEGIEGIIPNSELSYRRVNKPESVVRVGEEVEVKVIDISPEERRMTLSKRQAEPMPEPERPKEREHGRQSRRDPDRITIGDVLDEDDRAALTSRSRRGTKAKAEAEAEAAADAEERELMYEQDEE